MAREMFHRAARIDDHEIGFPDPLGHGLRADQPYHRFIITHVSERSSGASSGAFSAGSSPCQTFSNSVTISVGRAMVWVTGDPSTASRHNSLSVFSSASARTNSLALIVG